MRTIAGMTGFGKGKRLICAALVVRTAFERSATARAVELVIEKLRAGDKHV